MDVNEIQIGGGHYRKAYQHWDFVCDTDMPYLLGCATKYPTRWKEKNGIEDLRKCIHYVQKAEYRGVYMPRNKWYGPLTFDTTQHRILQCTEAFVRQLPHREAHIIRLIVEGSYQEATRRIEDLIKESIEEDFAAEADGSYTNQDPTWFKG